MANAVEIEREFVCNAHKMFDEIALRKNSNLLFAAEFSSGLLMWGCAKIEELLLYCEIL